MQPRCGCVSVKTLMETDFFRFLPTYIIVTIAMPPHRGSASGETLIQTLIFSVLSPTYDINVIIATTLWICKCARIL